MHEYSLDEVQRALAFVSALGDLCEEHGFYLNAHGSMFVERVGDGVPSNLGGLFEVWYRDGYVIQRPIQ